MYLENQTTLAAEKKTLEEGHDDLLLLMSDQEEKIATLKKRLVDLGQEVSDDELDFGDDGTDEE